MNVRPIEARPPSAGCPWRLPRSLLLLGLILLLALMPTASWGSVSGKVRRGNREYNREKFDQALQHYRDAQLEDPESPPLHFNIANALHKKEDWEGALAEYRMTLSAQDSALAQGVHYNMGNTLYRQGNYPEAIESYEKALRINPDDMDAKYNLELAQMKLQEPPQQQQQQPQEQQGEESQEEGQDRQQREQQQEQGETQKQQDQKQHEEPGEQEKRQQQQAQEQREQQQPPPRPAEPGQMSPQEAAQLLNALEELEKKAQEERQRARIAQGAGSEWDW